MKPFDRKVSASTFDHTVVNLPTKTPNTNHSFVEFDTQKFLQSEADLVQKPQKTASKMERVLRVPSLQMKQASFFSQVPTTLQNIQSIRETNQSAQQIHSPFPGFRRESPKKQPERTQLESVRFMCRKGAKFFANHSVEQERVRMEMMDNAQYVTQLELRCSGYGVFQKYLTGIQDNFLEYFKKSIQTYHQLYSVKLQISGFDIRNCFLQKVLVLLRQVQNINSLSVHTQNLINAGMSDLTQMLEIMSLFGTDINCKDFSMQIAGWSFKDDLDFRRMHESFENFIAGCLDGMKFVNFRFEMSGLNSSQLEAQNFLKSVSHRVNDLRDAVLKLKVNPQNQTSVYRLIETHTQQDQQAIIQLVDKYILQTVELSREELHDNQLIAQFRRKTKASLPQLLREARVEVFHSSMVDLVMAMQQMMPHLENFTVDLRNWHSFLKMEELKRKLEAAGSISKDEYSMIGFRRVDHLTQRAKQDKYVKITFLV